MAKCKAILYTQQQHIQRDLQNVPNYEYSLMSLQCLLAEYPELAGCTSIVSEMRTVVAVQAPRQLLEGHTLILPLRRAQSLDMMSELQIDDFTSLSLAVADDLTSQYAATGLTIISKAMNSKHGSRIFFMCILPRKDGDFGEDQIYDLLNDMSYGLAS